MSVVKRISSDYRIVAVNSNVGITATTVTIDGNLVVLGSSTKAESINTLIYDNFVTLAAGQTAGVNLDAGIEIDRGEDPAVGLRWHEQTKEWQYTTDGSNWVPFSGGHLVYDTDPHLGGNLIVNDFMITSDPNHDVEIQPADGGVLKLGKVIRVTQIDADPMPADGYSTLYAKPASSGNTGLYVSNDLVTGDEIITKRKAFVYSLIF